MINVERALWLKLYLLCSARSEFRSKWILRICTCHIKPRISSLCKQFSG